AGSGDELHRPADLIETLVREGRLGQEAGRGFYTWADGSITADELTPSADDRPVLRHEISTVGVAGTGTMPSGIVEVFAKAGHDVVFVGRSEEKLAGVRAGIEKSLDKAISRGKLDEETKQAVLGRLRGATEREALADV